jgi:hypothetical protein
MDANPSGNTPLQFLHSKFAHGVFWITCANECSQVWIMRTISGPGELWEGAELAVLYFRDLPMRPRVFVHIPDISEVTTVVTPLRIQNPELNMVDWLVTNCKVTEKE